MLIGSRYVWQRVDLRSFAYALGLLFASVFGNACGPGDQVSQPVPSPPAESQPATPDVDAAAPPPGVQADVGGYGTIVGRVMFEGDLPRPQVLAVRKDVEVCGKTEKRSQALLVGPEHGVRNVVVFLDVVSAYTRADRTPTSASSSESGAIETVAPVLDQVGCVYQPHVLLVPTGTPVDIKNSDGILHNIHTYSVKNPAFNMAQPKFKNVISKTWHEPEMIRVTCDVHDWMTAWLVVHDQPYYALTDRAGGFRLSNVPVGEHTLRVWHEELGERSESVSVTPDSESTLEIRLSRAG